MKWVNRTKNYLKLNSVEKLINNLSTPFQVKALLPSWALLFIIAVYFHPLRQDYSENLSESRLTKSFPMRPFFTP